MKRLLVAIVILVALSAGTWYLLKRKGAKEGATAGTDTHVVDTGEVSVALKETGVVKPRQTVAVKSKVSGKIREVLVAEGEKVRSGQLVAVVEPDAQAQLTLSQRRLELRRRKIELDQKDREWQRQRKLTDAGLAASRDAEEAERDYRTAKNFFDQERAALNLLEKEANQPVTTESVSIAGDPTDVTDYRILAPIDGIVATVKVKPGELAMSGTTGFSQEGALLMEIADERQLEVVVDVNEIDVPKIRPGMPVKVTLSARPGKPIDARVDRVAVAPGTNADKLVVFPVHIVLPERPPELRQGMTASVDLTLETRSDVVRAPMLAVGEKDGKGVVKIRKADGTLEDREVEVGLRSDKFVEIRKGLAPKDVIAARYPKEPEAGARR